jgi:hypothetical protein
MTPLLYARSTVGTAKISGTKLRRVIATHDIPLITTTGSFSSLQILSKFAELRGCRRFIFGVIQMSQK